MKSTLLDKQNQGMATEDEIIDLQGTSLEKLILLLSSEDSCQRSTAAINLRAYVDQAAEALLVKLTTEKYLYTRIAICETLAAGSMETAQKMISYLGTIGNNQHKSLPYKPSAKKSFPLPRDIIARYLGRMDAIVFPALMEVLISEDTLQIREVLDAVGLF